MDNEITINGEVYVKKNLEDQGFICLECDREIPDSDLVEIEEEEYYAHKKCAKKGGTWPQEGDEYFYMESDGRIEHDFYEPIPDEEIKNFGNFFQTKEEAQMYSLRIESLSKGFMPKEQYDEFWVWNFKLNKPDENNDRLLWIFEPKFPTKEECQEWYDKYGHAWLYLLKKNSNEFSF